jgi:ATP phosphoribosyltransferase
MLERARSVLARIHAEEEARGHRRIAAYFGGAVSEAARMAAQAGRILAEGPQELTLFLPKDKVAETADALLRHGAERVLVSEVDYAFSIENPLFDKLNQALDSRRVPDLRAIA